jgi:ubiquitin fusion degradation protein 1
MIHYNNKNYYLTVMEVKPVDPTKAISIVETDVNLEFAPPLDDDGSYGSTSTTKPQDIPSKDNKGKDVMEEEEDSEDSEPEDERKFKAFTGSGYTVSGKTPPVSSPGSSLNSKTRSKSKVGWIVSYTY